MLVQVSQGCIWKEQQIEAVLWPSQGILPASIHLLDMSHSEAPMEREREEFSNCLVGRVFKKHHNDLCVVFISHQSCIHDFPFASGLLGNPWISVVLQHGLKQQVWRLRQEFWLLMTPCFLEKYLKIPWFGEVIISPVFYIQKESSIVVRFLGFVSTFITSCLNLTGR